MKTAIAKLLVICSSVIIDQMQRILCFVFLLTLTGNAVFSSELDEVRKAFYRASMEKEICESIYNKIKDNNYDETPLMLGYKGVYQAIMAKYLWNPFSKWWYFQTGVDHLEQAIQKDQNNIELIFLRFSIQTNCPSFLGYDSNIKTDKAFIMKSIMDQSTRSNYKSFMNDIINYLLESQFITSAEKGMLMKVKSNS